MITLTDTGYKLFVKCISFNQLFFLHADQKRDDCWVIVWCGQWSLLSHKASKSWVWLYNTLTKLRLSPIFTDWSTLWFANVFPLPSFRWFGHTALPWLNEQYFSWPVYVPGAKPSSFHWPNRHCEHVSLGVKHIHLLWLYHCRLSPMMSFHFWSVFMNPVIFLRSSESA